MSSLIDLSCLARFKEKLLEEAGSLAGLPLGFEYFQTNPNIQAGSLPLTGGLYSRSIYSDLWAWLQEQDGYLISEAEWQAKANANGGAVPFYSDGDGSTTFRVPALIVWVKGKNGNEAVGDYLADSFASHKHDVSATSNADIGAGGTHTHEASTESTGAHTHTRGTMEISGTFDGNTDDGASGKTGAFYDSGTSFNGSNGSANGGLVGFAASRSWSGKTSSSGSHTHTVTVNSNGDHTHTVTVNTSISESNKGGTETRPKTIVGIYCVIAFGTVTNSGSMDLEAVQSLLLETQTVVEDGKAIFSEAVKGIYSNTGEQRDRDPSKPTYGLK